MSTLLSLPNEILVEIIEDTRPGSIWSFVRSCKSMWILGAGVLQQHQQDVDRFQESKIELFCPFSWRGTDTNSYTFLSNILLKPRRTLYVKNLLVEDARVNVASFRRGDTYEAACLALTLLPNLEVLSLKNWEGKRCAELIFEILKTKQSPHCKTLDPQPLHKLHTVIIEDAKSRGQPF